MTKVSEKTIIAQKVGMTRMSVDGGQVIPVTLLKVSEQKVTKALAKDSDGYDAIQVGFYKKSDKNLTKRIKKSPQSTMFYFCSLAPGNGASKHQNPGPGNRNKTFKNVIEMIARLPAPPAPLPP